MGPESDAHGFFPSLVHFFHRPWKEERRRRRLVGMVWGLDPPSLLLLLPLSVPLQSLGKQTWDEEREEKCRGNERF